MEALYAKLYNKYDALKKKRISELDEINKDQELKFLNYVTAAEELIQHLKVENDKLQEQVSELRNQVASIRSTKDNECAQYQKLLMEENQKSEMLSKEVERLQKLQEQLFSSSKNYANENMQHNMLETPQVTPGEVISDSIRTRRKRSREDGTQMEGVTAPGHLDDLLLRESAQDPSRETLSIVDLENEQQPECCKRTVCRSANGVMNDGSYATCRFQDLIECLLGMKFSSVNKTEGICISAQHQSSGYAFNLTWIKKGGGEEPELLYQVSTLGTFERVAPEWMRSVLMFSTSMCPIFFERVARVIKMHH
ncbi:uncharacterized protein LOC110618322 isoform X2 [Manihot esculenta]|uniref:DUF7806 domain-containing protein n=2 Tax=Manihot esculenta TaxID=3983 RepID=A0A251KQW8_MANES|nr:uncharacterized protein LOC110618322 isoform X2 [Manihot esculenta]XP_021617173.1 uncharacterized protein LOC110618322 isoform X2 [Manihot esculenta]XP_021617174.1 uncharacterized protein LOC110618322 isoform X2 [Manihot esculenta]XP_021617176.1 uncharacterized protein LOC110618322 isoform X2 [Manihot esculenta]XP_021617177.1 uncharacterized protein LOC110618322 isoform X2 [Manihot esculenta]KAG8653039.1 hypothetical protein MANES_06G161200v8 [Manihot esculenta]OAY48479.1 hypothetical prot